MKLLSFAIVLGLILIAGIIIFYPNKQADIKEQGVSYLSEQEQIEIYGKVVTPLESFCSKIRGTPAWIKDGEVVDYGYKKDWKTIPEGYIFFYHPDCIWCQRQIELWGQDYFNSLLEERRAISCI